MSIISKELAPRYSVCENCKNLIVWKGEGTVCSTCRAVNMHRALPKDVKAAAKATIPLLLYKGTSQVNPQAYITQLRRSNNRAIDNAISVFNKHTNRQLVAMAIVIGISLFSVCKYYVTNYVFANFTAWIADMYKQDTGMVVSVDTEASKETTAETTAEITTEITTSVIETESDTTTDTNSETANKEHSGLFKHSGSSDTSTIIESTQTANIDIPKANAIRTIYLNPVSDNELWEFIAMSAPTSYDINFNGKSEEDVLGYVFPDDDYFKYVNNHKYDDTIIPKDSCTPLDREMWLSELPMMQADPRYQKVTIHNLEKINYEESKEMCDSILYEFSDMLSGYYNMTFDNNVTEIPDEIAKDAFYITVNDDGYSLTVYAGEIPFTILPTNRGYCIEYGYNVTEHKNVAATATDVIPLWSLDNDFWKYIKDSATPSDWFLFTVDYTQIVESIEVTKKDGTYSKSYDGSVDLKTKEMIANIFTEPFDYATENPDIQELLDETKKYIEIGKNYDITVRLLVEKDSIWTINTIAHLANLAHLYDKVTVILDTTGINYTEDCTGCTGGMLKDIAKVTFDEEDIKAIFYNIYAYDITDNDNYGAIQCYNIYHSALNKIEELSLSSCDIYSSDFIVQCALGRLVDVIARE